MAELVDVSFFAFSYIFCKFRLNTKEGGGRDRSLPPTHLSVWWKKKKKAKVEKENKNRDKR